MQILLIAENPITEEEERKLCSLPIVFGRDVTQLPDNIDGKTTTPIILNDGNKKISRFHGVLKETQNQVVYEERRSIASLTNGKKILKTSQQINNGDVLEIGTYSISLLLSQAETVLEDKGSTLFTDSTIYSYEEESAVSEEGSTIFFNPKTDLIESQDNSPASPGLTEADTFPPANFIEQNLVSISSLRATNLPIEEKEYISLGGGLGSFVYVDHLRVAGVPAEKIAVVGLNSVPYNRYERLLNNCQIPRYKRIRSGSDSCPDNLWGWPGYAIREAWKAILSMNINESLGFLWQVFAEPIFADTYTPRADDVFKSIDKEANRISWQKMFRLGSIRSIRKTDDGRYCVAYSATTPEKSDRHFLIGKFVHLCTGYPALKLLDDLRQYRETTGDLKSVVQGYEPHSEIYEQLERKGGTVILRGSGIVASQIMDRLYLVHKQNPNLKIIHLNRRPRKGFEFGFAKRQVENDWEFQPYNWPKATWGGDMRKMLEEADPPRRRELLQSWGGTTTASRKSWRQIVKKGLQEGWYDIQYGLVKEVQKKPQGNLLVSLITNLGESTVSADFIIDCTGLISEPMENPLLKDLITHYNLDLNVQRRLHVENDFEITKMRNGQGKMYASGIITLGGPYAAVDTFLGLQYSAHRILESLAYLNAPDVKYISGFYSLVQWLKWAKNQKP